MSEVMDTIAEVSYKDGATELFLAIEEMEWRDAFGIVGSEPKQVRTWITSSGADDVAISSWRRLPIHEVSIERKNSRLDIHRRCKHLNYISKTAHTCMLGS